MSNKELFPNPVKETATWCERNRPDAALYFRMLQQILDDGGLATAGEVMVIGMAFAAGREYGETNEFGYPRCRKHDVTGWPCPRCREPAWTGDRGCKSCGLTLEEAHRLNNGG